MARDRLRSKATELEGNNVKDYSAALCAEELSIYCEISWEKGTDVLRRVDCRRLLVEPLMPSAIAFPSPSSVLAPSLSTSCPSNSIKKIQRQFTPNGRVPYKMHSVRQVQVWL